VIGLSGRIWFWERRRFMPGESPTSRSGSTESAPELGLSRRTFIGAMGAGAAALSAGGAISSCAYVHEPGAITSMIKRGTGEFMLPPDLVYMNNGSLGPTSVSAFDAAMRAWRDVQSDPVVQAWGPVLKQAERALATAANYLACGVDELAVTRNTTEGMNLVAQGINLQPGDAVLTTDHEHAGGSLCWRHVQKYRGVRIDDVTLPVPANDVDEIMRRFERAITPQTKVISVSHVTYTTGMRLPITHLAQLAEAHDCLLIVDDAQGPGVQDRIAPMMLAQGMRVYTGASGTRDLPAIVGMGAAIDFLRDKGVERVAQHAMTLRNEMYARCAALPNVAVASPGHSQLASPLVTLRLPPSVNHADLARRLHDRHRIVVKVLSHPALKGIRISAHVYNTADHVDQLVRALRAELS
jgi:selenocysteine lyase/cysteine desulfurase